MVLGVSSRGLGSYHDGRNPDSSLKILWHRFCIKKGLRKRTSPEVSVREYDLSQFSYVDHPPADPVARIFKGRQYP